MEDTVTEVTKAPEPTKNGAVEAKADENITLEYYKAPFGKRIFAFCFDLICMALVALGFFAATRLIMERSATYKNAFNTYVSLSEESGLYVYHETEDNLVTITEYYNDGKREYAEQNKLEEDALTHFYKMDKFFDQTDSNSGIALYNAQKIGDKRIGAKENINYFVYSEGGEIVANPEITAEKMHSFYLDAVNNGIQYLNNLDDYVAATKVLSKTVNFIIIPVSISLSFIIFEFLVPLIFYRRGWQTFGMKIFSLSIISSEAISPKFKVFFFRFLWMFFVELLGSSMTFAVPLIVSFSMMAFRKDGQCFHDYMTGTYMVDSSEQSIYLSKDERAYLLKKAQSTEARTDLLFQEAKTDPKKP